MSGTNVASDEFSVAQFFASGDHECVLRFVTAKAAVARAVSLVKSLGGRLGTTTRVIITDGGDNINFEWRFGAGVTFPPAQPRGGTDGAGN